MNPFEKKSPISSSPPIPIHQTKSKQQPQLISGSSTSPLHTKTSNTQLNQNQPPQTTNHNQPMDDSLSEPSISQFVSSWRKSNRFKNQRDSHNNQYMTWDLKSITKKSSIRKKPKNNIQKSANLIKPITKMQYVKPKTGTNSYSVLNRELSSPDSVVQTNAMSNVLFGRKGGNTTTIKSQEKSKDDDPEALSIGNFLSIDYGLTNRSNCKNLENVIDMSGGVMGKNDSVVDCLVNDQGRQKSNLTTTRKVSIEGIASNVINSKCGDVVRRYHTPTSESSVSPLHQKYNATHDISYKDYSRRDKNHPCLNCQHLKIQLKEYEQKYKDILQKFEHIQQNKLQYQRRIEEKNKLINTLTSVIENLFIKSDSNNNNNTSASDNQNTNMDQPTSSVSRKNEKYQDGCVSGESQRGHNISYDFSHGTSEIDFIAFPHSSSQYNHNSDLGRSQPSSSSFKNNNTGSTHIENQDKGNFEEIPFENDKDLISNFIYNFNNGEDSE